MRKKEFPDYCLGLDIGTNSVGWAAIDDGYELLKLCGKDAWGALLIDNAESAAGRRLARSARRRLERRRERIRLLRELFAPLIAPVDEKFFVRLDESSLHVGEGEFFRENRYNIFDGEFTDKDYFRGKDTRTVYHLRRKLMESDEKVDIRLVYLAVHHIVKYRGHFLLDGKAVDVGGNMLSGALDELFDLLEGDTYGKDMRYSSVKDKLLGILQDKRSSRARKREGSAGLFAAAGFKKYAKAIAGAVLGYKVALSDVLDAAADGEEPEHSAILGDNGKKLDFSFADGKYDENEEIYLQAAEERTDIFLALKRVYSAMMFDGIMRGKTTLSAAMVDKYEKHAKDLRILKKLFREHLKDEYDPFFRGGKGASYTRYIGDKSHGWYKDKTSQEELYKELKKLFERVSDCEEKEYCLLEMERDDLLPLINSVANAHIPYQLNEVELSAILDRQGKFYPQLIEDKEKIMSLLTFRRPYYVGPLKGDKFGWNKQAIEGRVTPWNFYDKVDVDALAESFITRMTNNCRIFPEEEALPKNSVIWQKYVVLGEINKLKVKEKPISVELKKALYEEVCCRKRKVKAKDIAVFFSRKLNEKIAEEDIKGLAGDALTTGMTTLIDLKSKLGDTFDPARLDDYEESVRTLTIFDDLAIRRKRLRAQHVYTDNQIEALCRVKYTGWGSFSRRVLCDARSHDGKSIIELLYDTNKHFNELIYDDELGFKQQFAPKDELITHFVYEDLKDLRCSPIVKKVVWNALRLSEEIVDITGKAPKAIFLENTQEEDVKKKKDSRVEKLSELYDAIKGERYFDADCYARLKALEKSERLNDEAFYLWLTQLGRCMYSGDPISYDEVASCQIDHIVPRCYIKDDSFSNRVLVKTDCNQAKSGTLGIHPAVVARMKDFWGFLFDKDFITEKKFRALQKTEYTDADRERFVERQLVDTSYSVKQVRELLQKRFPEAEIRGIKAGLNSSMRHRYQGVKPGFYKIRSLNNFHHAKDAYLTAVLGQFTTYACPFWGNSEENRAIRRNIMRPDNTREQVRDLVNRRYGIVLDLFASNNSDKFLTTDDGAFLWDETRRDNVFATMAKNTCNVVKKQEPYANAAFYKQTIISPREGIKALSPLKYRNGTPMPVELYGGYTGLQAAYFAIVEKDGKKGGRELVFGMIPVIVQTAGKVEDYVREEYGKNAVIRRIVRKYQPIVYKGHLCYVAGESELQNAVELFVNPKFEEIIYIAEQRRNAAATGRTTRWDAQFDARKERNDELFVELLINVAGKIERFDPLYSEFAKRLVGVAHECAEAMSTEEKLRFITDMLTVTAAGPGRIALDKKYGGGQFGRLSGKTIYPAQVIWLDMSLTGLRVRERKEEV